MAFLIQYFDLEDLKGFSEALEKVEELRQVIEVQVANIELEDEKIKLVLHVPADSLRLLRDSFPAGVLVA
ncbi:hypothetical protein [Thermococcus sp.]